MKFNIKISMLDYIQMALMPAAKKKEHRAQCLEMWSIIRDNWIFTKSKPRRTMMQLKWDLTQDETLDESEGKCDEDYCAGSETVHRVRRGRMVALLPTVLNWEMIRLMLPQETFPNGFLHDLLLLSPSDIKKHCDFLDEKHQGFFDRCHDKKCSHVTPIVKIARKINIGREVQIFDSVEKIEIMKLLLSPPQARE